MKRINCDICSHKKVCKNKEAFAKRIDEVEKISNNIMDAGEDFTAEVKCNNYDLVIRSGFPPSYDGWPGHLANEPIVTYDTPLIEFGNPFEK